MVVVSRSLPKLPLRLILEYDSVVRSNSDLVPGCGEVNVLVNGGGDFMLLLPLLLVVLVVVIVVVDVLSFGSVGYR